MANLDLTGKKILFIGPVFYDYHTLIREKIEALGADVTFFSEKKNGFLFGVLNNLNPYLIFLYQRYYYHFLSKKIKGQKFTHFFLIRGYKIPSSFIEEIKKNNPGIKLIMYQWDSDKNNPYFSLLKYFNKSYTFDYGDYKKEKGVEFLQLFYTEDIRVLNDKKTVVEYDFFCFSSFTLSRYEAMISFMSFCEKRNLSVKSFCYIPYTTYFRLRYLSRIPLKRELLSFKPMPRNEYLSYLDRSEVVVDLNHSTQTGLSMRIIEAYGAGKKILTTNSSILNNPVYSPEWVQLLDLDHMEMPVFTNEKDPVSKSDLYIDNWINVLFS